MPQIRGIAAVEPASTLVNRARAPLVTKGRTVFGQCSLDLADLDPPFSGATCVGGRARIATEVIEPVAELAFPYLRPSSLELLVSFASRS